MEERISDSILEFGQRMMKSMEDSPDIMYVQAGELGALHLDGDKVVPFHRLSASLQTLPMHWVRYQVSQHNAESFMATRDLQQIVSVSLHHTHLHRSTLMHDRNAEVFTVDDVESLSMEVPGETLPFEWNDTGFYEILHVVRFPSEQHTAQSWPQDELF